ncbi:MAG: SDR family NAD(P)-dependent oxidoreductase [Pseudohongiellaceae bacterium]
MKNDSANPKVVLITGGAARIGASIAKHLHKIGFNIVLHYNHSKTAAETLCAELNSCRNNSAYCFEAELLDIADIERLFINTLAVWGKLDILINNASNFYPTPLTNINEWQWDELLGVNAKAPVFFK